MTDIQNFILRPMLPEDDTKKFSLGNSTHTPLKMFLQNQASEFHQLEIAKTYVLAEDAETPSRVWGYISLMNSEITLNADQKPREPESAARYDAFPAIKIARLAVDKRLQGNGYGTKFLEWCIGHIKFAIAPHVGCRFLVVDAKRDSVSFYQKSGFVLVNTEDNMIDKHPLMFFDLITK